MLFTVMGRTEVASKKTDGIAYCVFLKGEDGNSYTTWVDTGFRNYRNWQGKMEKGLVLDGLVVKKGRGNQKLIDADSLPRIVKRESVC